MDTSSSETSVGQLVSNATEQMSQLVRSEVELAKTELAESAKKGGIGAGFFGGAGTIALYSSFFFSSSWPSFSPSGWTAGQRS